MNIRLYNAQILTMEQDVPVFQGEIWVENNIILSVIRTDKALNGSDSAQPSVIWDREIDCKGNLLMPGFKDAHTHSAMTFLRSFADDVPLQEWLEHYVFPMEAKITGEDIYHFTKFAIRE